MTRFSQILTNTGGFYKSNGLFMPLEDRYWTVRLSFHNPEALGAQYGWSNDETEFDIQAYNSEELEELWNNFCEENGFNPNSLQEISIVATAETMEELEMR